MVYPPTLHLSTPKQILANLGKQAKGDDGYYLIEVYGVSGCEPVHHHWAMTWQG